jgi:hypothetical protein
MNRSGLVNIAGLNSSAKFQVSVALPARFTALDQAESQPAAAKRIQVDGSTQSEYEVTKV